MAHEKTIYLGDVTMDIYQHMLDEGIGTGGEKELIDAWDVDFGNGVVVEVQLFDLIDDGPYTQALLHVAGQLVKRPMDWRSDLDGEVFEIPFGGDTYKVTVARH